MQTETLQTSKEAVYIALFPLLYGLGIMLEALHKDTKTTCQSCKSSSNNSLGGKLDY